MAAQPMTGPWTLRMSADMAATLRKHLFPGDGDEHGAVIGASVVTTLAARASSHEGCT